MSARMSAEAAADGGDGTKVFDHAGCFHQAAISRGQEPVNVQIFGPKATELMAAKCFKNFYEDETAFDNIWGPSIDWTPQKKAELKDLILNKGFHPDLEVFEIKDELHPVKRAHDLIARAEALPEEKTPSFPRGGGTQYGLRLREGAAALRTEENKSPTLLAVYGGEVLQDSETIDGFQNFSEFSLPMNFSEEREKDVMKKVPWWKDHTRKKSPLGFRIAPHKYVSVAAFVNHFRPVREAAQEYRYLLSEEGEKPTDSASSSSSSSSSSLSSSSSSLPRLSEKERERVNLYLSRVPNCEFRIVTLDEWPVLILTTNAFDRIAPTYVEPGDELVSRFEGKWWSKVEAHIMGKYRDKLQKKQIERPHLRLPPKTRNKSSTIVNGYKPVGGWTGYSEGDKLRFFARHCRPLRDDTVIEGDGDGRRHSSRLRSVPSPSAAPDVDRASAPAAVSAEQGARRKRKGEVTSRGGSGDSVGGSLGASKLPAAKRGKGGGREDVPERGESSNELLQGGEESDVEMVGGGERETGAKETPKALGSRRASRLSEQKEKEKKKETEKQDKKEREKEKEKGKKTEKGKEGLQEKQKPRPAVPFQPSSRPGATATVGSAPRVSNHRGEYHSGPSVFSESDSDSSCFEMTDSDSEYEDAPTLAAARKEKKKRLKEQRHKFLIEKARDAEKRERERQAKREEREQERSTLGKVARASHIPAKFWRRIQEESANRRRAEEHNSPFRQSAAAQPPVEGRADTEMGEQGAVRVNSAEYETIVRFGVEFHQRIGYKSQLQRDLEERTRQAQASAQEAATAAAPPPPPQQYPRFQKPPAECIDLCESDDERW
uniref:Uncharacterized protein n=1 Tax=Chromera velia CCMP2878 TaxID=1169474 RepID=A0A0G4HPU0_9ALVE|eukprot:Cvel_29890.t1-p1 / transcript=Cvel_29890.t1 / gene=Cvel_29890 / organism=Chromera_velia_CCMP2878 / gene_product=hypothetical protein / transcript_product=hypothetical protein / location=Cvel_scaffold4173:6321-9587(+) / protein_length=830 / sequence_SO=supercontig / SO=protein_coding / is_pseudo=false